MTSHGVMTSRAAMTSYWLLPLLVLVLPLAATNYRGSGAWGWRCVNQTCTRELQDNPHHPLPDLSTCKLTCRPDAGLWPRPTGLLKLGNETVHFLLDSLTLGEVRGVGKEVRELVGEAFNIFLASLTSLLPPSTSPTRSFRGGDHLGEGVSAQQVRSRKVVLSVSVSSNLTSLSPHAREAYTLTIRGSKTNTSTTTVTILASNFYGARHALETLSQLVQWDEHRGALQMVSRGAITDAPVFHYRGLMVDTSVNFLSVKALQRTLDGMAASKLNTLHLHLTDTTSFPLYLPGLPKMAYYGAYTSRSLYTAEDLRQLHRYARVRGVRLVPEIDGPAHAGNGWQWGPKEDLGNLAVCINQEPWAKFCSKPPCGQLNPANNQTYTVLSTIYSHLRQTLHPLHFFHFGGSEVNFNCWKSTKEIMSYLEGAGRVTQTEDFYRLWGEYQTRVQGLLRGVNKERPILAVVRSSSLTEDKRVEEYLSPKEYVIQVTTPSSDPNTGDLLRRGYRLILSHSDAWDLGCGFGQTCGSWQRTDTGEKMLGESESMSGRSEDKAYKGWQAVYNLAPHSIAQNLTGSSQSDLVLGGEAVLWGHQVDEVNIDAKLWPRGSALGERLWSNPSTGWDQAETRFIHHRQLLVTRGIMADRIQPQWCHQNEALCYL